MDGQVDGTIGFQVVLKTVTDKGIYHQMNSHTSKRILHTHSHSVQVCAWGKCTFKCIFNSLDGNSSNDDNEKC